MVKLSLDVGKWILVGVWVLIIISGTLAYYQIKYIGKENTYSDYRSYIQCTFTGKINTTETGKGFKDLRFDNYQDLYSFITALDIPISNYDKFCRNTYS